MAQFLGQALTQGLIGALSGRMARQQREDEAAQTQAKQDMLGREMGMRERELGLRQDAMQFERAQLTQDRADRLASSGMMLSLVKDLLPPDVFARMEGKVLPDDTMRMLSSLAQQRLKDEHAAKLEAGLPMRDVLEMLPDENTIGAKATAKVLGATRGLPTMGSLPGRTFEPTQTAAGHYADMYPSFDVVADPKQATMLDGKPMLDAQGRPLRMKPGLVVDGKEVGPMLPEADLRTMRTATDELVKAGITSPVAYRKEQVDRQRAAFEKAEEKRRSDELATARAAAAAVPLRERAKTFYETGVLDVADEPLVSFIMAHRFRMEPDMEKMTGDDAKVLDAQRRWLERFGSVPLRVVMPNGETRVLQPTNPESMKLQLVALRQEVQDNSPLTKARIKVMEEKTALEQRHEDFYQTHQRALLDYKRADLAARVKNWQNQASINAQNAMTRSRSVDITARLGAARTAIQQFAAEGNDASKRVGAAKAYFDEARKAYDTFYDNNFGTNKLTGKSGYIGPEGGEQAAQKTLGKLYKLMDDAQTAYTQEATNMLQGVASSSVDLGGGASAGMQGTPGNTNISVNLGGLSLGGVSGNTGGAPTGDGNTGGGATPPPRGGRGGSYAGISVDVSGVPRTVITEMKSRKQSPMAEVEHMRKSGVPYELALAALILARLEGYKLGAIAERNINAMRQGPLRNGMIQTAARVIVDSVYNTP